MEVNYARKWEELIPDVLELIFEKLPLENKLTVVPSVCKSWENAAKRPYCWQDIDIRDWSTVSRPHKVNRMIRLLVPRSCGLLRSLHVYGVNNDHDFEVIAQFAGSLQSLALMRSKITDSTVEKLASKFTALRSLDLSYCYKISTRALEALGKNCRYLSSLRWNMNINKRSRDEEARAIASTMPKLKRLELVNLHVKTQSILQILSGCPALEYLDITGCWMVHLDCRFLQEKHPNLKFEDDDIWADYVSTY